MKKLVLLILLILPLYAYAQDMPFAVRAKTKFASSGMVGYETIDSLRYYRARWIPEFKIKKVQIGLDLDFLFDKKFRLRTQDWDHLIDYLYKIYYLKYGKRNDMIYGHMGGFPNTTIGNGLIMGKYSNMALYPEMRNLGFMIGGNPPILTNPSFELFSSNLFKNEIISFSARCKPMPDSTLKVIDDMVWGISIVTDRNQYSNLKAVVPDSVYSVIPKPRRQGVTVFGIAVDMPLYKDENYIFGTYSEFANIIGLGSGAIIPGLYADFHFVKLNLEYRRYGRRFDPAFFDEDYEEERGQYEYNEETGNFRYFTKRDYVKTLSPADGINGSIQGNYKDKIKASVTWQNVIGETFRNRKSLWLRFWADTQYHRWENFSISYSRTNQRRLSIARLNEHNTKLSASSTFRINDHWYAIAKLGLNFKDRNNDGVVKWGRESRISGGLGLKYVR
ncbi:MAG TPA: hypothetical protein PL126_04450 [Candidatus Cloacimonadota bacterium]|nr:hypothetical protein [Candidatus Cloacimonadota bacterium]